MCLCVLFSIFFTRDFCFLSFLFQKIPYIEFGGDDFCLLPLQDQKNMAIAGKSPCGIDTSSTSFFRS